MKSICDDYELYEKFTGFELACIQGNLNIVKFLILNGIDFEKLQPFYIIRLATESKNVTLVQYLMSLKFCEGFDHDDLDLAYSFMRTGELGDYEMTKFYLKLGIDINIKAHDGQTIFHFACCSIKDNVKFLKWLIKQGSEIKHLSDGSWNGFHYACSSGNFNIAKFLVEKGVFDINQTNTWGMTGFHYICKGYPNLEIIQYLIHKGCDINLTDEHGCTALEIFNSFILSDNATEEEINTIYLCMLFLIENKGQISDKQVYDLSSEVRLAIKNRLVEITYMKNQIFETFTEHVAQVICDFTMLPITNISLQTTLQILLRMY
jgi:hypothetical protein